MGKWATTAWCQLSHCFSSRVHTVHRCSGHDGGGRRVSLQQQHLVQRAAARRHRRREFVLTHPPNSRSRSPRLSKERLRSKSSKVFDTNTFSSLGGASGKSCTFQELCFASFETVPSLLLAHSHLFWFPGSVRAEQREAYFGDAGGVVGQGGRPDVHLGCRPGGAVPRSAPPRRVQSRVRRLHTTPGVSGWC